MSDGSGGRFEDINDEHFRMKMLAWRLRLFNAQAFIDRLPWQHLSTCYLEGNTVFVFVVVGNKAVTIEDDPNLYPSDTLISALRLLIEAK